MDTRPFYNNAWFLVLPAFLLVAFNAIIPLMTVVNYSVQDSFGNNEFFWNGVGWYKELLDPSTQLGERFYGSLGRNLLFSFIVIAIEVPLGIAVALAMPKKGWTVGSHAFTTPWKYASRRYAVRNRKFFATRSYRAMMCSATCW